MCTAGSSDSKGGDANNDKPPASETVGLNDLYYAGYRSDSQETAFLEDARSYDCDDNSSEAIDMAGTGSRASQSIEQAAASTSAVAQHDDGEEGHDEDSEERDHDSDDTTSCESDDDVDELTNFDDMDDSEEQEEADDDEEEPKGPKPRSASRRKKQTTWTAEELRNKELAAERRLKNSGKFWKNKVLYDFVRVQQRGKRDEQRAALQWKRNVTHPLAEIRPGVWLEGRVRNIESFGAYVDVGAEKDGLLHVRDMSQGFTARAKDVVATGDTVRVQVKRVDAGLGKLHLSLVEVDFNDKKPAAADAKALEDLEEGQEMWGEVTKVSNFGAFVQVGAEVEGFLHIMEYPKAPEGARPSEVFHKGQRLRTYIQEVDLQKVRLKLTGQRPDFLPSVGRDARDSPYLEEGW